MTNDATGEHPGSLESPAPPLGEAAAFVAKLFSGCDQQLAVGEDTPSSMDRAELATADSDSIPTAGPPAALPHDHDEPVECATPLPPTARGLPQYSNTTISLIVVVLAVLTFGSGLWVGYGILGQLSKGGSKSTVQAAKSPVDREAAPSKKVDDQPNAGAVPLPNPTVASVEPSATQLSSGHAGVLSESGSDNNLQRPAAKAPSGQSEETQAITKPPRVPAYHSVSRKSLGSVNSDSPQPVAIAAQPMSAPSRPPVSDGTMQSVGKSAQPADPEGTPIASAHTENVLPVAKASDGPSTTASPGLSTGATEPHVVPGGLPEEQRRPIVASTGQIDPCQLIHSVQPVYPREAKKHHVEGDVELRVVVGTDGTVHSVGLVRGLPLLVPAALNAAREFRYKPASLNGQPIETVQTVDMSFKLKN